MSFIKRMKIDIILISAVLVGLGVVVLLKPGTTGDVICYVLAGAAIAVGICFLIDYLKKEALVDEQRYVLAISLTAVMVGVALFLRHDEVVTFMPTALSFLILFSGAVKLQNSWDMKRLAHGTWVVHAIIALIGMVYGFVLMMKWIGNDDNIWTWIGVGLIYSGFTDLVSAFVLARIRKVITKRKAEVDMKDVNAAADATAEATTDSANPSEDGE